MKRSSVRPVSPTRRVAGLAAPAVGRWTTSQGRDTGAGFTPSAIRCLLLAVLLWSSIFACRSESPPGDDAESPATADPVPAARQRLRTVTIADPRTFNPITTTDVPSRDATMLLFDSLVRFNPRTTEVEPFLAERWEVREDGTEYLFYLRHDVQWHDGQPLTARDVVFTFAAIYDDRVPNSSKHVLKVDGAPIEVTAVGDHVVRMRTPRPFAPLLNTLPGIAIIPEHILGEYRERGTFAQQWGINTPPDQLVGTGPYRMTRYVPARQIQFHRNPNWWMRDGDGAPLPFIEEQTILIVPNQDAAYMKFISGGTDVHIPRPEEVGDIERQADRLGIRLSNPGVDTGTLFVTFNRNARHFTRGGKRDPRLGWFTDRAFLRAMAHSVDREGMVVSCLHGHGQPAVSHISPENTRFHNPNLEPYEYDLALAGRLLEEAGYIDRNGDGLRQDRDGNRIEFSLHTNAGNQIREKIAAILKEDWTKLGLKVNYRPIDFTLLVEKLDNTFDWDAILIGFTGGVEPHNSANLLLSAANLHLWSPNQPQPETEWEAEIDRLVAEGARELDEDGRRSIYWRIQEILHEELPMIQTVRPARFAAYSTRLRNFEMTPWGLYRPERVHLTE